MKKPLLENTAESTHEPINDLNKLKAAASDILSDRCIFLKEQVESNLTIKYSSDRDDITLTYTLKGKEGRSF